MHRLAIIITLSMLLTLPAPAAAKSTFTPQQQEQIGKIASDYLLTHPDILDQLEQKRQAQLMKQQSEKITELTRKAISLHHSLLANDIAPQIGPTRAEVVVINFYDYRCLPCGKMTNVITQMIKEYPQVRFVFRDRPVAGPGWSTSETASAIGIALWQQHGEAIWLPYHLAIFSFDQTRGDVQVEDIAKVLRTLRVAVPDKQAVTKARQVINESSVLAQKLQLSSLPTLIVMPLQGAAVDNTSVFLTAVPATEVEAAILRCFSSLRLTRQ